MTSRDRRDEYSSYFYGLVCIAILLVPQVSALDGHEVLVHSPNITLSEDTAGYTEFSNYFDLDGDRLVWMNTWAERKVEEKLVRNGIYLMNLSDNSTTMISETPGNHHEYSFRPPVSLSGHFVVFSESMNNNLFLYDSFTGGETALTSDGSAPDVQRENAFPSVDGDRVVWSKRKTYGSSNDQDIVFMNLSTGIGRDICTQQGDQTEPALSGQRIVWTDTRNEPGGGNIYLYDMGTGVETPVCTEKGLQQRPRVSGDSIVWMDYRDGTPAVYLYTISSGRETRISRDNFVADAPLLSGNLAVWQEYSVFDRQDERAGTIVIYDTATGARDILPTGTFYPQLLAADNNRILYANPDQNTLQDGFVHLFVMDVPASPSPSVVATSLAITTQETPTMVFGPSKTTTQSAPGSLATVLLSVVVLFLIFHTKHQLKKK
jgi:beta propeller repeat protein